jgi:uncharacterized protein YacL
MGLIILRLIFVMVAAGLGVTFITSGLVPHDSAWLAWASLGGMLLLAAGVIALDVALRSKQLDTISAVYFGLIVGLFMTYILGLALAPLQLQAKSQNALQLILGLVLCYTCISLLMQTKDDFRFIIPYVEFARDVKGVKPLVLDTSVVIDGRIADVVETGVFDSRLIMPKFVIGELQAIADSSDRMRRGRGRRGLDILNRLRNNKQIDIEVFERELPEFDGQPVDLKLVALTKHLHGKLVTNDYNLNKVAKLQGIEVLNLNDLANSLKPVFLPGERIEVRIVKPGEEAGQGVGYLEDGTMIVVEGGRDHVNQSVDIAVTSVLQTSAGRMIFGRFEAARTETARS